MDLSWHALNSTLQA